MTWTVTLAGRLAATPAAGNTVGGARVTILLVAARLRLDEPPERAIRAADGPAPSRARRLYRVIVFDDVPSALARGTSVTIHGTLHATRWTDPQGQVGRGLDIVARQVRPGDGNGDAP